MAQIKTTIGKVGFVFKDQWVEGESYDRLDIVSYNGSSYVSLIDDNDSSIENNTKWRLLVTKGEDGKAVYFHIRYSNDGGKTFTGNNGKDVGDWLGTYSDNISDDSTQISSYTWVKIKGNQGDTGKIPLFSIGTVTSTVNPTVSLSSDGNDVNGNPKFLINFGLQKGEKGDQGIQGEKGETGVQGPQGIQGETGPKGDIGPQGEQGIQGIQGERGLQGEKGDTGSQGEKGEKGEQGEAATIKVGTVSSGATATVTNSGTINAAILNFTLPKGDKGDTFTYDDLTSEQKAELQKPATDMIASVNEAISNAKAATEAANKSANSSDDAEKLRVEAESKRVIAEENREKKTSDAITNAETATNNVNEAVDNANDTANHPTKIGEDYYVYTWNKETKTYDKTSIFVRGASFSISHIFSSISEMESYTGTDINDGDFVIINTDDVENEDNAKLYIKDNSTWSFIVDMSGFRGFTGKTPQFSIGTVTSTTGDASAAISKDGTDADGNPTYKLNFSLKKGDKGDKGDRGDGFKIMGYYSSLDALKATITNPSVGDIYGIGTASPYDIYVFDGITNQWINNGSIQGVKGDDALINGYNTLTITGGENISVTQDGSTLNISSDMVASNYLSKTNTTEYTPTSDYNPSTKKYVDDKIGNIDFSALETQINSNTELIDTKANSTDVYTREEINTKISNTLQLGETSTTAYRGDRGKTAYDHSQVTSGNPHKVTKSDIGLENVDNTADSSKSVKYATSSGSTTNDSDGQQINTTYIKGLSVNGKTITYTKGDNKTGTLTTQDTTYSTASQTANGLMSSADKTKLDGIAEGANNYTHPSYTAKSSGLYKVTVDSTGHVSATTSVTKSDITGLGVPASDTTYSNATTSINGLMSSEDKTKLDSISSGAEVNQNAFGNIVIGSTTIAADSKTDSITLAGSNVTITPDATNDTVTIGITKTNVTDALGYTPPTTNTTYSVATTSDNGLMSSTDKAKLDKIAEDATKVTIDSSLSSTSTNPVLNKIINTALSGKSDTGHTHDDRYYTETEIDSKLKDLLDVNDAMIFKGVINNTTPLPSTHKVGWTYRVGEIGTYAGVNCELGDLVICITDGITANNSHWTVAQTNIDGAVVGPSSSTDTNIAIFNGTTGHVIEDSGKKISDFAASDHTHTITASSADDDVIVLTGTNGINSVSYTASHANSGVSAGTYKSVTVNAKGHITAGTNPTTLSGYGITDAKKVQTAVASPTANGNSLSFIDTISQDTQGIITATKKNITIDSTLSSTSTNPVQNKVINAALSRKIEDAPSDSNEYVRKDGAWVQSDNKEIYKLPYSLFELTSSSTEADFLAIFESADNFIQLVKNASNYIFCINETRAETNSAASLIAPLDVNAYYSGETTYYYATFGFFEGNTYNLVDIVYGDNEGTLTWTTSGVQYIELLTPTNTNSYTPTSDYNPATKKYVDDLIKPAVYEVSYKITELTTSSTSDDILAVFGSVDNFKYIVNNASTLAIIISKAASDSDGALIQNIPTQFYGYCLNVSDVNYYVGKFDYFDVENNSIKLIGIQLAESTSTFSVEVILSNTVATQNFVTNAGYLTASQVQALIDASVTTVLNTSV